MSKHGPFGNERTRKELNALQKLRMPNVIGMKEASLPFALKESETVLLICEILGY